MQGLAVGRADLLRLGVVPELREGVLLALQLEEPRPATQFIEGGRVSQTLDGMSKTLFDSTMYIERLRHFLCLYGVPDTLSRLQ